MRLKFHCFVWFFGIGTISRNMHVAGPRPVHPVPHLAVLPPVPERLAALAAQAGHSLGLLSRPAGLSPAGVVLQLEPFWVPARRRMSASAGHLSGDGVCTVVWLDGGHALDPAVRLDQLLGHGEQDGNPFGRGVRSPKTGKNDMISV